MAQLFLRRKLQTYVEEKEKNGIRQRTAPWEKAKAESVGGSTLSVVQGINPHSTLLRHVAEKVGLELSKSGIAMQWGVLFEPMIKLQVEHDHKTEIIGSELFIPGPIPDFNYSPDGLGVIETTHEHTLEGKIVKSVRHSIALVEFKCPYSRIPNGAIPKYYTPQVKSGLDTIEVADIGLYCEAVIRRCTWSDLGNNPVFDRTLVPRASGKNPVSYGFVGFYFDDTAVTKLIEKAQAAIAMGKTPKYTPDEIKREHAKFEAAYADEFELGDDLNDYLVSDLGMSTPALFELLMNSFDMGMIQVWYSKVVFIDAGYNEDAAIDTINEELGKFTEFCRKSKVSVFGMLPWKLFRVDYHFIDKDPGYLARWQPQIAAVVNVIKRCNSAKTLAEKRRIYSEWVNESTRGCFSDD